MTSFADTELSRMRDEIAGKRIGIAHYGEHTPCDDGYRPARMGQLAVWLTEAGAEVVRVAPTFSKFTGTQRPESWSGSTSSEGVLRMVPARDYPDGVTLARVGFLRDFAVGVGRAVAEMGPFDAFVVGYPPPGVVTAVRRAGGTRLPIVADIRDLWPDALVPPGNRILPPVSAMIGRALAQELRLTSGVVAMSETMLARAPSRVRRRPIPHSIAETITAGAVEPAAGLAAVFVASFSQFFDYEAFLGGWRDFATGLDPTAPTPTLRVFGAGPFGDRVAAAADGAPSIELHGWVAADEVPAWLARSDVGIAPTRRGFGTTLNNKALEYLGAGLFIVNSFEAATAEELERHGFGLGVGSRTRAGWAEAFTEASEQLGDLRRSRPERRARALHRYGRAGIEPRWLQVLTDVLADGQGRATG